MKRAGVVLLALLFALSIAACGKGKEEGKADKPKGDTFAAGMAKEISATIVSNFGGRSTTAKMFMKSGKVRFENEMAAGSYTIVRPDLKKVWMVMTANKSYMEMSDLKEQASVPEEKMKGEVSRKEVGKETIDGHPTTKYEVTAKMDDKVMTTYQWWATDINFPVKSAAVDGSWSVEYREIKIGGQPDSLFELPAGYQKMSMPSMPGKAQ